jgi:ribulose-phosphate 3-epimerase
MIAVCPCILAQHPDQFEGQLNRVKPFARRLHIDLSDGVFAPNKTVGFESVKWPSHIKGDLHLMYKNPSQHMRAIVNLKPHMVIVHAEADGDFLTFAKILRRMGIKIGVALLAKTPAESIFPALQFIDHVMIFSGKLGHYGGATDLGLLAKAQAIKHQKPSIELGWDGGVNDSNAHLLVAGGIDVLNVGGFIQKASDPAAAYATIKAKLR